jgi:hypothetical protein
MENKMSNRGTVFLLCTLLVSVSTVRGQEKSPANNEQLCLRFAQAFYNWYINIAHRPAPSSQGFGTWAGTLKYEGRNPFSPEIAQALIASDVESKADGDPALDFDPVLYNPCIPLHYVVRRVTRKNDHYWADVYDMSSQSGCRAGRGELPDVVAEMVFEGGHWQFVNFHYPDPDPAHAAWVHDLLGLLRYHYQPK